MGVMAFGALMLLLVGHHWIEGIAGNQLHAYPVECGMTFLQACKWTCAKLMAFAELYSVHGPQCTSAGPDSNLLAGQRGRARTHQEKITTASKALIECLRLSSIIASIHWHRTAFESYYRKYIAFHARGILRIPLNVLYHLLRCAYHSGQLLRQSGDIMASTAMEKGQNTDLQVVWATGFSSPVFNEDPGVLST